MTTTIPRSADADPFYRYKRIILTPTLSPKNGGTTVIRVQELQSLSRQIARSDIQILGFVKRQLSCSVTVKGSEVHIRKTLTREELDNVIEQFINAFVICGSCGNPETYEGKCGRRCNACGNNTV